MTVQHVLPNYWEIISGILPDSITWTISGELGLVNTFEWHVGPGSSKQVGFTVTVTVTDNLSSKHELQKNPALRVPLCVRTIMQTCLESDVARNPRHAYQNHMACDYVTHSHHTVCE